MRIVVISIAALLCVLPSTSVLAADVTPVDISGTLAGTSFAPNCNPPYSECSSDPQTIVPFNAWFNIYFPSLSLSEGVNPFSAFVYGTDPSAFVTLVQTVGVTQANQNYGGPVINGTITDTGGVLTVSGVSYADVPTTPPDAGVYTTFASATSLGIERGVPEPSTWAMMLIGLGAVGFWARRRGLVPLA